MKRSNFFHSPGWVLLFARSRCGGAAFGVALGAGVVSGTGPVDGFAGEGAIVGGATGLGLAASGSGSGAGSARELRPDTCRAKVAIASTTGLICPSEAFCLCSSVSTPTKAASAGGVLFEGDVGACCRLSLPDSDRSASLSGLAQLDFSVGDDTGAGEAVAGRGEAGAGLAARLGGGGCTCKAAGIGQGMVLRSLSKDLNYS